MAKTIVEQYEKRKNELPIGTIKNSDITIWK